jgi:multidrug efflux pump subunit AcrB
MNENALKPKGPVAAIVERFLGGHLSILLILLAFSLGTASIVGTPREEDPQIVLPMADIHVRYPGASAAEVEKLVATPLEKHLWQIDGVEHVYSVSRRDSAVVTVRFYVGTDRERAMVRLRNRLQSHMDDGPAAQPAAEPHGRGAAGGYRLAGEAGGDR